METYGEKNLKNKTHLRLQGRGREDCTTADNTPNHCNIPVIHHHSPVFQEKYIYPEKMEQEGQEEKLVLVQTVFQSLIICTKHILIGISMCKCAAVSLYCHSVSFLCVQTI